MAERTVAEGWYSDPHGTGRQRWWTGSEWTDQFRPAPQSAASGADELVSRNARSNRPNPLLISLLTLAVVTVVLLAMWSVDLLEFGRRPEGEVATPVQDRPASSTETTDSATGNLSIEEARNEYLTATSGLREPRRRFNEALEAFRRSERAEPTQEANELATAVDATAHRLAGVRWPNEVAGDVRELATAMVEAGSLLRGVERQNEETGPDYVVALNGAVARMQALTTVVEARLGLPAADRS